jgi:dihydroorotase
MFDLPTTLGKFLALGMGLADVIERATARPAKVLGVEGELGTLRPGAYADVALFRLEEGTFPFYDTRKERRDGRQRLRHVRTLIGGQEMAPLPVEPPAPWVRVSEFQQQLAEQGLP